MLAAINETNQTAPILGEEVERADLQALTTEAAEPTPADIITLERTTEVTGALSNEDAIRLRNLRPNIHLFFIFRPF